MIPVAPRIVNDVSCETRINHEIQFAWQAQCLVKLDCDHECFFVVQSSTGVVL